MSHSQDSRVLRRWKAGPLARVTYHLHYIVMLSEFVKYLHFIVGSHAGTSCSDLSTCCDVCCGQRVYFVVSCECRLSASDHVSTFRLTCLGLCYVWNIVFSLVYIRKIQFFLDEFSFFWNINWGRG